MEQIKNWLASPDFEKGVDLLEQHTTLRNMVRIMRRSGETSEHMETLKYELGKLVPAEVEFLEDSKDSNPSILGLIESAGIKITDIAGLSEETEEGKKQGTARVNTVLDKAKLLCQTLFTLKTTK